MCSGTNSEAVARMMRDAERLERSLRHLLPALCRHDLRTALGADLAVRGGARLADDDRLRRRRADIAEHHLERRDRRREQFVDRAGKAREVDAEGFLLLTALTFSLFGFVIGLWADGFEKLQLVPLLIVTPLTFLGGSFYSIDMLPPFWRAVTLFNPVRKM
jgi:hypothetical protein